MHESVVNTLKVIESIQSIIYLSWQTEHELTEEEQELLDKLRTVAFKNLDFYIRHE